LSTINIGLKHAERTAFTHAVVCGPQPAQRLRVVAEGGFRLRDDAGHTYYAICFLVDRCSFGGDDDLGQVEL
jgi:hypothetical protein